MKVPPVKLFLAAPELAAKFAHWGGFGDELRPQGCCRSRSDPGMRVRENSPIPRIDGCTTFPSVPMVSLFLPSLEGQRKA